MKGQDFCRRRRSGRSYILVPVQSCFPHLLLEGVTAQEDKGSFTKTRLTATPNCLAVSEIAPDPYMEPYIGLHRANPFIEAYIELTPM